MEECLDFMFSWSNSNPQRRQIKLFQMSFFQGIPYRFDSKISLFYFIYIQIHLLMLSYLIFLFVRCCRLLWTRRMCSAGRSHYVFEDNRRNSTHFDAKHKRIWMCGLKFLLIWYSSMRIIRKPLWKKNVIRYIKSNVCAIREMSLINWILVIFLSTHSKYYFT